MKKLLSVLLALTMVFACAVSALAEAAGATAEQKAEETEKVMEWLSAQLSEDDAEEILSWNKQDILDRLEGYEEPLEYTTKEEIADELLQTISLFSVLSSLSENSGEDGEELDLSGLLGGLLGGENGAGLVSALLGGLLSGGENGEGSGLTSLLGGLLGGGMNFELGEIDEDSDQEDESYQIVDLFDGTFWESGDLTLEVVFQDGYYKVAIREGDTELSYLCEYDELQEDDDYYPRLTGIGTGVEELDAEQEDHGIATFQYNDDGELVWTKPDGTEVAFTQINDPLAMEEWYVDGKQLNITWLGDLNYTVTVEQPMEGYLWTYQCVLDESSDTLSGTGNKAQYGDEIYANANVSFVFSEDRALVTWTDDKDEETAGGLTFEVVLRDFTMGFWQTEGVDDYIAYFTDGKYILTITMGDTAYSYVCTYDRATRTLTAADPATLNPDEYGEPENFRSTATFELLDENHVRWTDASGITGADGIVLERAV